MKALLQLVQNVLICEYKPSNRPLLRGILERQGYAVTMSSSLSEALQIFRNRPAGTFRLILVDVIQPENRMEWLAEVRQRHPRVRVLATSAYLGDGFLPPSSVAYLPKPFTSHELVDAVAAAMAGRAGHVLRMRPAPLDYRKAA